MWENIKENEGKKRKRKNGELQGTIKERTNERKKERECIKVKKKGKRMETK